MQEYREEHIATANSMSGADTEYAKTLAILQFFEDIGVLVARNYLKTNDLFDFMGGLIIHTEEVLRDHIKRIRNESKDAHIYANTLTLMKQARRAKAGKSMHSFNEGEYRMEG